MSNLEELSTDNSLRAFIEGISTDDVNGVPYANWYRVYEYLTKNPSYDKNNLVKESLIHPLYIHAANWLWDHGVPDKFPFETEADAIDSHPKGLYVVRARGIFDPRYSLGGEFLFVTTQNPNDNDRGIEQPEIFRYGVPHRLGYGMYFRMQSHGLQNYIEYSQGLPFEDRKQLRSYYSEVINTSEHELRFFDCPNPLICMTALGFPDSIEIGRFFDPDRFKDIQMQIKKTRRNYEQIARESVPKRPWIDHLIGDIYPNWNKPNKDPIFPYPTNLKPF